MNITNYNNTINITFGHHTSILTFTIDIHIRTERLWTLLYQAIAFRVGFITIEQSSFNQVLFVGIFDNFSLQISTRNLLYDSQKIFTRSLSLFLPNFDAVAIFIQKGTPCILIWSEGLVLSSRSRLIKSNPSPPVSILSIVCRFCFICRRLFISSSFYEKTWFIFCS